MAGETMKPLDRIDEKLLRLLQRNNRRTFSELSEQVGISASSCRRRIEALRRSGAIVADVSIVNPALAGPRLVVIALITLERDTPDTHGAVRRLLKGLPEAAECHYVAGTFDYVVQFRLASMPDYDALVERALTAHPAIKRVESLTVLKEVKPPIAWAGSGS